MPQRKIDQPIAVLGAGNWGTVIAILAAQNTTQVYLYDRNKSRAQKMELSRENAEYLPGYKLPKNILVSNDLEKIIKECQLIFPVIPSSSLRSFAREFAPFTRGDQFLVHGTKGLEPHSFLRMSEILCEETNSVRVGALSGPNLAQELAEGKIGASVVASRFDEVILATQSALSSSKLQIYGNHDLVGVEWAGALKNILAVAAGILHELNYGQNALAMILTRGIAEMSALIRSVGANSSTLIGLAGIGDIIATSTSNLSRNFRAGELLARGYSLERIHSEFGFTAEGINTISVAAELASQKKIQTPITSALRQIAVEGKPAHIALQELMDQPASFEFQF